MFYSCKDEKIRYTGRFGLIEDRPLPHMKATAPGAYFEFAYRGKVAVLIFEVIRLANPAGRLYLSVDGGAMVESTIDRYVHVTAQKDGYHEVKVIYKSCSETQHRWHHPLIGKCSLEGIEVNELVELPPDDRKTVEFVGDSITEGVLIEEANRYYPYDDDNRPFQDDVTGTYAWLTAENLNLRPFVMGYGAVGTTHGGNGGVPAVGEAYPYNFDYSPVTYPSCDYIVINHGANDMNDHEGFLREYPKLLALVRERNPKSVIIALSAFYGGLEEETKKAVDEFNEQHKDNVILISSKGWVPSEPLHPLRDGHAIIAGHLTEELKKYGIG